MIVDGRSDPLMALSMLVRASMFRRERSVACASGWLAAAAPTR